MSIRIFYDETDFRLKHWKNVKNLINEVIRKNGKITGDLNCIITNDISLRKINVQFLEHDYFTDVITFDYNAEDIINGEIYISIDTVQENALNYNISLRDEVVRVIVHGVFHLLGYDDRTEAERNEMRDLEDLWLGLFKEKEHGL